MSAVRRSIWMGGTVTIRSKGDEQMRPEREKVVDKVRDLELRAATVMQAVDVLNKASEKLIGAAGRKDWSNLEKRACLACRVGQGLLSSLRDLVVLMGMECGEIQGLCEIKFPCVQQEAV